MENSDVFRHYILTRFNTQDINGLLYDKKDADKWMDQRMELFEETKKSVLDQDRDFEWIISIDKRTPKKYLEKIKTDDRITFIYLDIRKTFDQIKTHTPWVITTRLDNDDLLRPGALGRIQDYFKPKVGVIDIDYHQLDLKTGEKYTSNRATPNSPFLSLVEHFKWVKTCYCRPHSKLYMGYPLKTGVLKMIRAIKINEILAYMVIHENNVANKIVGELV